VTEFTYEKNMDEENTLNRREFFRTAGAGAAIMTMANSSMAQQTAKRRYAMIGTGHRGTSMWGADVAKNYADKIQFVGLCDINPKRVEAGKKLIGVDCPTFTDFNKMCADTKPDVLMVTTVDATHVDYITSALAKGIDVITEKPMVTDEKQLKRLLDAEKKSGRKIAMAFNYRFAPKHQKIKEILMSGEIGDVTSVDFSWYLECATARIISAAGIV
jgi:predicted dehydrogenase